MATTDNQLDTTSTANWSRKKLLQLARAAAANPHRASDEALLVAWDIATERAERYNWGPKTTAEVERLEALVIERGLSN